MRRNCFVNLSLIYVAILLLGAPAIVGSAGQGFISIDKEAYSVEETVTIFISLDSSRQQEFYLSITCDSNNFAYKGEFNPEMFFYPTEEGIYTSALVEKSTGATFSSVSFLVSGGNSSKSKFSGMEPNGYLNSSLPLLPIQEGLLAGNPNIMAPPLALNLDVADGSFMFRLENSELLAGEKVRLLLDDNYLKTTYSSSLLDSVRLYHKYAGISERYMGDLGSVEFLASGKGMHELIFTDSNDKIIKVLSFVVSEQVKDDVERRFPLIIKGKKGSSQLLVGLIDEKGDSLDFGSAMNASSTSPDKRFTLDIIPGASASAVRRIQLVGVRPDYMGMSIGVEDLPDNITAIKGRSPVKSFAVDPSAVDFSNGSLTSVAVGTELYKCKEWNFSEQRCYGSWVKVMDIIPGEEYSIALSPDDPAFVEIFQPSTRDSYVAQNAATTNYGTATTMVVQTRTSRARRSFVDFDLSSIPANGKIILANISLYQSAISTAARTLNISRVTGNWIESGTGGITWNTQPGIASTTTSSISVGTAIGWYTWPVTADVQGMVEGTYPAYGWRISDSNEIGGSTITHTFYTKEYATNTSRRPRFEVYYTIPPIMSFLPPTPDNMSSTTNLSSVINISINESSLKSFAWIWDNYNHTFYDSSLVLMMNLDNVSSLGEGPASNFTKDVSLYSNNGSCFGMGAGCNWTDGRYGKAISFDGANDYINISSSNSLNLTGNMSVEAWIFPLNITSGRNKTVLAKGSSVNTANYYLGLEGQEVQFGFYSSGWRRHTTLSAGLQNASWYHLIATYDFSEQRVLIYLNGNLVLNESETNSPVLNSEMLRIGTHPDGGNFSGKIDELRIWNLTISPSAARSAYESSLRSVSNTTWNFLINQSYAEPYGQTQIGYQAWAEEFVGNASDYSESRMLIINATNPSLWFDSSTTESGSLMKSNWIIVNASAYDINLANITVYLYDDGGYLVDSFTSNSSNAYVNFSGLADGTYYFNATAFDVAGNSNSTETWNATIDNAPPMIAFVPPTLLGGNATMESYVEVNASASDYRMGNITVFFFDSVGAFIDSYNSSGDNIFANFTGLSSGLYFFNATAVDYLGNQNSSETINITVDQTSPVLRKPFINGTNFSINENVCLNISVDDTFSGVAVVLAQISPPGQPSENITLSDDAITSCDQEIGNGVFSAEYTIIFSGAYNWSAAYAWDLAGNKGELSVGLEWNSSAGGVINVSMSHPLSNIRINESGSNNGYSQNCTASCLNGGSNCTEVSVFAEYFFDGNYLPINASSDWLLNSEDYFSCGNLSQGSNCTHSFNITSREDSGNHTFPVRCRADSANSATKFSVSWNVSVNDHPISSIDYPKEGGWLIGSVMLNASTSFDPDGTLTNFLFEYDNSSGFESPTTICNSPESNCSWDTLTQGQCENNTQGCYLRVTVTDNDGLTNSTYILFGFDTQNGPVIELVSPYEGYTDDDGNLTFAYYVTDLQAGILNCSLFINGTRNQTDDQVNLEESSYFYLDDLGDGVINWSILCWDNFSTPRSSISEVRNLSVYITPEYAKKGIIFYGEGGSFIPRYRVWNGRQFEEEENASSVGAIIRTARIKSSATRDEFIAVTVDSDYDANVQVRSDINRTTNCWHNGTACGGVLELTATTPAINRLRADVAYEQQTGRAIVVYTNGTVNYRIWNGSSFSQSFVVPQTSLRGIISYVRMAEKPDSNEIALIMTNTTTLNIMIWNGSEWGCEPASLPSTIITREVYQHADLAYEQLSGDLLVVSSVDGGITELDYTRKENGSCVYTTSRTTTLAEESESVVISAQHGSDYIMIAQRDTGGDDVHAIVWDGSSMRATSGNDQTTYATDTSPRDLISTAWAGTSPIGLFIYSDAATSLGLSYMPFNITTLSWLGGTAGLTPSGLTAFSDEEEIIISYSFLNENKTMILVKDDADDLWAKVFNANTNSWSDADGGVALEDNASSANFASFDFAWLRAPLNPETIFEPPTENTSFINRNYIQINVSAYAKNKLELVKIDLYDSYGNLLNSANSTVSPLFFNITDLSEGLYYFNATTTDSKGNINITETRNVTIDLSPPITSLDLPADFSVINALVNPYYMVNATAYDSISGISVVFFIYREDSTASWKTACNDSDGIAPFNCTWNMTGLNGTSTYEVRAYSVDNAGNIGDNNTHVSITLLAQGANISRVFVDDNISSPIDEVDLQAGGIRHVYCNISVDDPENYSNILGVNATLYSSTVSFDSEDSNRTHYSGSCLFVEGIDTSANYLCEFKVQYFAVNGTWTCRAFTWNNYSNHTADDNTSINRLFALNISTLTIDYTDLGPNETSPEIQVNIINLGNSPMNVSVYGFGGEDEFSGSNLSMICNMRNISVNFEKYSLSSSAYAAKNNLSSVPTEIGFTIPPSMNETDIQMNSTYWQFMVPAESHTLGECNGSVVFMAEAS